jgi:ATP-binding cassette subfamily C (CFTR/MRP) protein 1
VEVPGDDFLLTRFSLRCNSSLRRSKIEAVRELKADSKPKEHSEKGQVKRAVYAEYIKAASRIGVAGFLLSIVLAQATSIRKCSL